MGLLKRLSISGLATNTALYAVENKIPNINNLVKKTACDTKNTKIKKKLADHDHDKYITNPEFNTLAANIVENIVENESKKLKTYDLSYFLGKVILKKMVHKII